MSNKNVILRVAVRRASGETVVQDLEFTKTLDRNYATYAGQISIPNTGSGAYTISAVLMSEKDGRTFLIDMDSTPASMYPSKVGYSAVAVTSPIVIPTGNTLEIGIPYISNWQPISIAANNVVEPVTLNMKPYGTVLRMRIKNESASERVFKRIFLSTNAFGPNAIFFLDEERDGHPWDNIPAIDQLALEIPDGGVTVPGTSNGTANYSNWMYVWVAPYSFPTQTPKTTGYVATSIDATATRYKAFHSTQALMAGGVPMTLVFNESHAAGFDDLVENPSEWGTTTSYVSPLESLSLYALDKTGNAFVTDYKTDNANIGKFTFAQAQAFATPRNIDGAMYSLPSREELHSIFPPALNSLGMNMANFAYNTPFYDALEEDIKIGDITASFKADYYRKSPTTLYGIRFKSTDNRFRTAFRYSLKIEEGQRSLVIESTPISTESITLSDIQSDSFWTTRTSAGKVTNRRIPAYGVWQEDASTGTAYNAFFQLWSSTGGLATLPTAQYLTREMAVRLWD